MLWVEESDVKGGKFFEEKIHSIPADLLRCCEEQARESIISDLARKVIHEVLAPVIQSKNFRSLDFQLYVIFCVPKIIIFQRLYQNSLNGDDRKKAKTRIFNFVLNQALTKKFFQK